MTPVLLWALKFALFLLALAMLCALGRLLAGPTAQDRVMALDCLYINGMLMMLVLGIVYASNVYFEAAMLIALFAVWLLLNQSLDPATLLMAAALAVAVPLITQGLRPARVRMRRPGTAIRLLGRV
ncbi:MAG: hypothetical protein EOO24_37330, partial [Comamonadaceae bacterium]